MSHDIQRGSRGSCRWIRVLTSLSLVAVSIARGQTNSWTDGNGKWENSNNWSQVVAPSLSDSANLITNAGSKTVTIDATTSTNFPATLTINNLTIAGVAGTTNTLQVINIGTIEAPLEVVNNLQLLGGAALIISNGGQVYGTNATVGGLPATSNNLAVVTGSNSVWSLTGALYIGSNTANSSLIISNGGTLNVNGSVIVGSDAGGTFHVSAVVTGTNSIWQSGFVTISVDTPGLALTVANGAQFVGASSVQIGRSAAANGDIVLVTDPGSTWSNAGILQVSAFGSFAQFIVSNGATAYSDNSAIGANVNMISNAVVVTGPGSVWTVGGSITIADSGTGSFLMTTNGGLVMAQDVFIAGSGGAGSLIVAGGTNLVFDQIQIGKNSGAGTVSVLGGALFVTNATATAEVVVNTNSALILGAGLFKADNLIVTNGGAVQYAQTVQVNNGSVTVAGGSVQADSDFEVATAAGSTVTVSVVVGTLIATNGVTGIGNDGTATNGFGVGTMTVSGTFLAKQVLLGSSAGGQGQLTVQPNGLVSLIGTDAFLLANDVTIDGGDVEILNGQIFCGKSHPGAMTMSNGTANSQITYVGYDSQGTLTMLAGQMTISSLLDIGFAAGSTGSVWMSGGQLTATALPTIIGNSGVGQMCISNGSVTMAGVVIGNSSNPGTLTLAGGTLTVFSSLSLGDCGGSMTGIVTMTGGTLYVTNAAHNAVLEVRSGQFLMTGGAVVADRLVMTNGCGLFQRTGGSISIGSMTLDPNLSAAGDGIPNGWKQQYDLDPLDPYVNSKDADGTGQNNLFKFVAGLDPTNPASVFVLKIASVTGQPTQKNLIFNPEVSGRTYTPQFRTNMVSGAWAPLTGTGGPVTNVNQVTVTDTNAVEAQKFYRIDISLP